MYRAPKIRASASTSVSALLARKPERKVYVLILCVADADWATAIFLIFISQLPVSTPRH
ncbi:hypothetical protein TSAR_016992 [Trichomalopsis sarcophagae]|uniref:Uncharacterized protein n=1 Tax=Trichomalopsis sarcophagae TaxID=543379 RepID=A0A232EMA8_9HYME|nr:hypothetical protein TSAR_016992 [Trichomalopsis sarcophagae]